MKKQSFVLSAFIIAVSILSASCSKDKTIKFDETYPLALAPDIEWAVVKEPYAAYRKTPDMSADVNGHCRKSEILQVQGTALSSEDEIWYHFSAGWLPETAVIVYKNRFKDAAAVKNM